MRDCAPANPAASSAHPANRTNVIICTSKSEYRRRQQSQQWCAEGGYDPIAEELFTQLDVDAFLLEYESERAGTFEPLRFLPAGKSVVLGLVSSKLAALETQEDLLRRIDEAARYVPLESLALSPQ